MNVSGHRRPLGLWPATYWRNAITRRSRTGRSTAMFTCLRQAARSPKAAAPA